MEKHGCTSKQLLLPNEDAAELAALRAGLLDEYQPTTPKDRQLVEEAARSLWMLGRNNRRFDEIEQVLWAEENDSTKWTDAQWKRLELRTRYRTTAERGCSRALRGLDHVRRSQ